MCVGVCAYIELNISGTRYVSEGDRGAVHMSVFPHTQFQGCLIVEQMSFQYPSELSLLSSLVV